MRLGHSLEENGGTHFLCVWSEEDEEGEEGRRMRRGRRGRRMRRGRKGRRMRRGRMRMEKSSELYIVKVIIARPQCSHWK